MLIKRIKYTEKISQYIGTPIIKVLTGMRRSGKSCLMKLLIERLKEQGICSYDIIYINKELIDFDDIRTYHDLNDYIMESKKSSSDTTYLFIDEVQEIEEWEKCVASLSAQGGFDIYLTGSNAHLLSSELATLLSGRYVEIPVYTLTFSEFLLFRGDEKKDLEQEFKLFLRYGGLPVLHHFRFDDEMIYSYVKDVLNAIILKDLVQRNNIRNVSLLNNILRFVFDNVGNIFSAKKVSDYLKSQKIKSGVETVQNYLHFFCSSYVLHKVPRYDIKGKRFLEFNEKYFINDIGLHDAVLGGNQNNISGILENIIYLELLCRGYKVSVGKQNFTEIDFIAEKQDEKIYIQVAYMLASQDTVEREFAPLLAIKNHHAKMVLSLDKFAAFSRNGIQHKYILDFLTEHY